MNKWIILLLGLVISLNVQAAEVEKDVILSKQITLNEKIMSGLPKRTLNFGHELKLQENWGQVIKRIFIEGTGCGDIEVSWKQSGVKVAHTLSFDHCADHYRIASITLNQSIGEGGVMRFRMKDQGQMHKMMIVRMGVVLDSSDQGIHELTRRLQSCETNLDTERASYSACNSQLGSLQSQLAQAKQDYGTYLELYNTYFGLYNESNSHLATCRARFEELKASRCRNNPPRFDHVKPNRHH